MGMLKIIFVQNSATMRA